MSDSVGATAGPSREPGSASGSNASLPDEDRELAYVIIDVQRGKIGTLTAITRIRRILGLPVEDA